MATYLRYKYYYSNSGTIAKKEQVVAHQYNSDYYIIMATSAFRTRVNYIYIRYIIY